MNSFPFDSDVTYDGDGNPIFDRAYDSENLRSYFHLMFTDGIFMVDNSIALLVTTSEQDMSVVVKEGNVNIQGALGIETSDRTLVFEAAGTTYDRIDAVVARLNTNHDYRKIDLYVVKGTEETAPVAPSITRTGGIYELRLANVFIAKNTTTISAERITDTRLVTDECGVVTANPQGTDTEQIFNQYQASLDAYMQYVEECIDGTTAGNLQNQITALFNNQADEFSATKTYEVGDYCIYQNKLYKCVTAIETGAAWDSSKWEATTVGGEMASLNKGLANVNSSLAFNFLGYVTGNKVLDFSTIPTGTKEIKILLRYFNGTEYTKLSQVFSYDDLTDSPLIFFGAGYGGSNGIGMSVKVNFTNKGIYMNDLYFNGVIPIAGNSNIQLHVLYR